MPNLPMTRPSHTCHTCDEPVDPATCHIIWTYAIGSDASYCDPCGWAIRDPFGDRYLSDADLAYVTGR